MSNTLRVKVADSQYDLSCIELDNWLWEPLLTLEYFVKLTTSHKRHDEIKTELRLEEVVHANKEWMITAEQDILLELSVIDLVIL